jgi:hypothetical protein
VAHPEDDVKDKPVPDINQFAGASRTTGPREYFRDRKGRLSWRPKPQEVEDLSTLPDDCSTMQPHNSEETQ